MFHLEQIDDKNESGRGYLTRACALSNGYNLAPVKSAVQRYWLKRAKSGIFKTKKQIHWQGNIKCEHFWFCSCWKFITFLKVLCRQNKKYGGLTRIQAAASLWLLIKKKTYFRMSYLHSSVPCLEYITQWKPKGHPVYYHACVYVLLHQSKGQWTHPIGSKCGEHNL